MWDDQKRKRLSVLREPGRQLDAAEQAELASLVKELEGLEAAYLNPATERLRQKRVALEQRHARLAEVVKRKQAFVNRLDKLLAETATERRAIDKEFTAVLAEAQASEDD